MGRLAWIGLVLCLSSFQVPAMRQRTLMENWQEKLICECKEVDSVNDCPNYKKKKDGFPPSFPRFYHHSVQLSTKYVNYCCGFTSSDFRKSWFSKKIQKEKEMCLEERRPLQTESCCHLDNVRGKMGDMVVNIKFARAYSMAHPSMLKKNGQKLEDLTFEDYEKKSNAAVHVEDISRVKTAWGKDFTAAEVEDAVNDFKRVSGLENPMCKESVPELEGDSWCEQPRKYVCCCTKKALSEAGKRSCIRLRGAEKSKIWVFRPIGERALLAHAGSGSYAYDWEIDFGKEKFAKHAPDFVAHVDRQTQEKIEWKKSKSKDQIASRKCVEKKKKPVGPPGHEIEKEYCNKLEITLACDGGKVQYERLPGTELSGRQYACKAGMKNNRRGDPDFDEGCHCK